VLAGIDDRDHAVDRQRRLRNVRGHDDLSLVARSEGSLLRVDVEGPVQRKQRGGPAYDRHELVDSSLDLALLTLEHTVAALEDHVVQDDPVGHVSAARRTMASVSAAVSSAVMPRRTIAMRSAEAW